MNWILIVITAVSTVSGSDGVSVAMQEFNDQYSCQQAERRIQQLVTATAATGAASATRSVRSDCMPKGAPSSSKS